MHRLVQVSLHNWLDQAKEKSRYSNDALQMITDRFPLAVHENKELCEQLYPHAQVVLQYDGSLESYLAFRAKLLYNVGSFENAQGKFDLAQERASEAYEVMISKRECLARRMFRL